jgi:hypothetical protein
MGLKMGLSRAILSREDGKPLEEQMVQSACQTIHHFGCSSGIKFDRAEIESVLL